jgi:hypothetical protein
MTRFPLACCGLLLCFTAAAFAQDVTTLASNPTPATDQIGAMYFDSLGQSQVWVNLEPASTESAPAPVILNFTATFPGRQSTQPPSRVKIRAESRCFPLVFPDRIRQPVLRLVLDGTTTIDLTTPDAQYQFVSTCSKAFLDTVVTDAPFDLASRIADAHGVAVDALGISVRLTPADQMALAAFVRMMRGTLRLSR